MQNHKTVEQLAIALNGKIVDAVSRVSGFVVSALFALAPISVTEVENIYGGGITHYISTSYILVNSAVFGIERPKIAVFCFHRCRENLSLHGGGSRHCCICGALSSGLFDL